MKARLHVLLAREARKGLVLRRGPSGEVCSVEWDRTTDQFELGQWVRARIYERRCDLSPDGRHLIYFARNSRWSSATKGSYTAISQAPYLKALVLLGKGDCWQGGGLFTSNQSYWLNGCHFPLRDKGGMIRDTGYQPPLIRSGECPGIYYPRLLRDGWQMVEGSSFAVFEKPLRHGWILRKYAHAEIGAPQGKGCYWDEHELENASAVRVQCPNWEWADWVDGAVVWAEGGCLYRADLALDGLAAPIILKDFNEMTFERRVAPY